MEKEILKQIDEEVERITKWLNKQDEDISDYFLMGILMSLDLNYFETLGLLEHLQTEVQRISNLEK